MACHIYRSAVHTCPLQRAVFLGENVGLNIGLLFKWKSHIGQQIAAPYREERDFFFLKSLPRCAACHVDQFTWFAGRGRCQSPIWLPGTPLVIYCHLCIVPCHSKLGRLVEPIKPLSASAWNTLVFWLASPLLATSQFKCHHLRETFPEQVI